MKKSVIYTVFILILVGFSALFLHNQKVSQVRAITATPQPNQVCRTCSRYPVFQNKTPQVELANPNTPEDKDIEMNNPSNWNLIWSDEFDGPAGSPVDPAKWVHDLGGNGWGNNELEYYTDSTENATLNGSGQLAITARLAPPGLYCHYGACRYTSARLKTLGKFEQQYGRIEARLKLPAGQGLWPAFWMLGNNFPVISWPACGEIDIMEYRGSLTTTVSSAMHGPGYSGNTPLYHAYKLPAGSFIEDYHLFAIEWEQDQIRFFVDQALHYTATKENVQKYGNWVFDHPFFILVNLAVGGHFDGDPASDSIFPATMLVDYVRVYQHSTTYAPIISK